MINQKKNILVKMASRLDGRKISAEIRQDLAAKVTDIRKTQPSFAPGLAIVQVGNREDSNVYIRMKLKEIFQIFIIFISFNI